MSHSRMSQMDALVVGGGVSGAVLSTILARAGRSVLLVEKSSSAHHKVCGDFLSGEALAYLQALDFEPSAFGGVPIRGVRLASRSLISEARLPFPAMSLTRRTLDEALLLHAQRAGVNLLRGVRVNSLNSSYLGWSARLDTGADRDSSAAFLATGKHDLPGKPRVLAKENGLVAFKMYFRLAPSQHEALGQNIELILFPGGYAGLQPVEDGIINLCLLVTRSRLRRCHGRWPTLFDHMLTSSEFFANRMEGAQPQLGKPLAISPIPYGFICRHSQDGLWRLGDQAAVIPSFTGDGVSIALHSAYLAASVYLGGGTAEDFQHRLFGELRNPVKLASHLSRLLLRTPLLAHTTRLLPSVISSIARATRIPATMLLNAAER
jgi:menaquinone-9 beta-reductase